MEPIKQTFTQYFNALRILHLAMVTGLIIYGTVVHVVLVPEAATPSSDSALFVNLTGGFLAITTAMAYWLFNQRMTAAQQLNTLSDKLGAYRAAAIIKYALIEGPTLAAITYYLVSGNAILIGIGALGALILLLNMPNPAKLKTELDLSVAEIARLDNPNEIVT